MKINITFKDQDGPLDAIVDEVRKGLDSLPLSESEKEKLDESRIEEVQSLLSPWLKYGEYVCIEFDTDAKTATVLSNDL